MAKTTFVAATIKEIGMPSRKDIQAVHFGGWSPGFKNTELAIPAEHLVDPGDFEHCSWPCGPPDRVGAVRSGRFVR